MFTQRCVIDLTRILSGCQDGLADCITRNPSQTGTKGIVVLSITLDIMFVACKDTVNGIVTLEVTGGNVPV
jgi:hypothetical protein